jgi:hypothetical protein
VPAAARKYGLEEAVRPEASGVMRARWDEARPSGPLASPLTFSVDILAAGPGTQHDDGQTRITSNENAPTYRVLPAAEK